MWKRPTRAKPDLLVRGLSHVEDFSSQREDAIAIPADHTQARHGQSLGRVSLSEDQRATDGVLATYQIDKVITGASLQGQNVELEKQYLHRWRHPTWAPL